MPDVLPVDDAYLHGVSERDVGRALSPLAAAQRGAARAVGLAQYRVHATRPRPALSLGVHLEV